MLKKKGKEKKVLHATTSLKKQQLLPKEFIWADITGDTRVFPKKIYESDTLPDVKMSLIATVFFISLCWSTVTLDH